ncbi:hypothetical protein C0585_01740 [Candidatus Woesearchaeota archaeon]|nr:MAG: hypothetical protein C0585_01740 [Candidatus Woesearchaeota archaeon]
MNYEDQLIEWTIRYVKHRDLMKKNLIDYKILKNHIDFEFKDKKHIYFIYEDLKDNVLEEIGKDFITFVVLNKNTNLNFLVKNWNQFLKNQNLNLVFVHPSSNQSWTVNPFFHNKIAEPKKLKSGLLSLFDGIKAV